MTLGLMCFLQYNRMLSFLFDREQKSFVIIGLDSNVNFKIISPCLNAWLYFIPAL